MLDLDFRLEKKLVFSLNEEQNKAFTKIRHYCEEEDLSFFDMEVIDGVASYFVIPDFDNESEVLLNKFDEKNNILERRLILCIKNKINEVKDFNFIEIKKGVF